MVVLVKGQDGCLALVRPSLPRRIRARLRAARSDRLLALGVAPEESLDLALRAQALVGEQTRQWLAHRLLDLLEDARQPAAVPQPAMTDENRRRLVESGEVLIQLVGQLERPAPLSSRGLAALCVLLRDGSGPLYGRGTVEELRERLGQVHDQLMPHSIW